MDFKSRFQEKTATDKKTAAECSGNAVAKAVSVPGKAADADILKILKRPRSKKYMKALKLLDIISENDKRIIAEMKKEAGLSEDADVTYTEEDMEAFRARVRGIIEEEIKKEEEELKKRELKKLQLLNMTYAYCYIAGCVAHTITKTGLILKHYNKSEISELPPEQKFAASLIKGESDIAEIRDGYIVHRNGRGDVIKMYNIEDVVG